MSKKNNDSRTGKIAVTILTIIGVICWYFSLPEVNAQPTQTQESEWVEVVSVELPAGLEIYSGITRNGNPKYWFEIQGIKVFISAANKEHYTNNTATILLVEWYNKSIDRYKYTTRQKKEDKQPKRINIKNI